METLSDRSRHGFGANSDVLWRPGRAARASHRPGSDTAASAFSRRKFMSISLDIAAGGEGLLGLGAGALRCWPSPLSASGALTPWDALHSRPGGCGLGMIGSYPPETGSRPQFRSRHDRTGRRSARWDAIEWRSRSRSRLGWRRTTTGWPGTQPRIAVSSSGKCSSCTARARRRRRSEASSVTAVARLASEAS